MLPGGLPGLAENASIGEGPLAPGVQVMVRPFATVVLAGRVRRMTARPIPEP